MGRVYNALVKADRLTDRHRPIGRPEDDAATRRHGDAATAATAPPARRDLHPTPVFGLSNEHHTAPPEGANGDLSSDFEQLFALSENAAARQVIEPTLPPVEESFA